MPTDTYEPRFSQTPFSAEDIARIMTCRREHNRLGFAYQLAFVRSLNRYAWVYGHEFCCLRHVPQTFFATNQGAAQTGHILYRHGKRLWPGRRASEKKDRVLNTGWIADQWDRMGHFYASLESGHATASTALRRLNGFTGKNHFYRANRELGRVIRTEHTLDFMSNPNIRRRTRRGLLKGEQVHSLARDIRYGHRGKLSNRDWLSQKHACSCLTLVIACIIYWQAKEIHRVIQTHTLPGHINLDLVSNISPVSWGNIILYGDYILNRNKVVL